MITNKIKYYLKNDQWFADGVPIGSLSRITNIGFQGIVQNYCHRYKNGKEEIRWKLVESLGPDDDIWFLLVIRFCSIMGLHKIIVKIGDLDIEYRWITEKIMRECGGLTLHPLEVAAIESEIERSLGQWEKK